MQRKVLLRGNERADWLGSIKRIGLPVTRLALVYLYTFQDLKGEIQHCLIFQWLSIDKMI